MKEAPLAPNNGKKATQDEEKRYWGIISSVIFLMVKISLDIALKY